MPPRLTKPTKVPSSRESLVELLWRFYIAAQRPTTAQIGLAIKNLPSQVRRGTAGHETIRRTLRGDQVGAWQTVEVIFLALCELADVDPYDADDRDDQWDPDPVAHIEQLRQCWNEAVDDSPMPATIKTRKQRADEEAALRPRSRSAAQPADDPWVPAPNSSGFSDEPPF